MLARGSACLVAAQSVSYKHGQRFTGSVAPSEAKTVTSLIQQGAADMPRRLF
jgi:hypothetical protein